MKAKILIADDFDSLLIKGLEQAHIDYVYKPNIERQEIMQILANDAITGLLIRSKTPVDKEILDSGNLQFVGRGGAGMDAIDVDYAQQKGIKCFNAGEANSIAVAEHAIGLLLSLTRNIQSSFAEVQNKVWKREENRGLELASLTTAIIGFGNTGSAFAQRMALLGSRVLVYDKYKHNFGGLGIEECTLDYIFEQADILSLHVPLTNETKLMINSAYLNNFKKPIFLINTSRGKVVCLNSVIEQLNVRKITGFATDVLENEDFKTFDEKQHSTFESVKTQKNVIITPHIAGWTNESYIKISAVLLKKVLKLLHK